MIDISGQWVRFHLSHEGRQALKGLVPAKGSFQALVVETENLGPLVWNPAKRSKRADRRVPVMLLKWDYIASLAFDYQLERGLARAPIGFTPPAQGGEGI